MRGKEALDYIEGVVLNLKRKYNDPCLIVAGDFNQWKVEVGLANFPDISEVPIGCTRGRRAIDRISLNVGRPVNEYGTLSPLEMEGIVDVRRSDHLVAYCRLKLKKREAYTWESYSYRRYTDEAE